MRDVHAAGLYILEGYVTWKERFSAFYLGGGQDIYTVQYIAALLVVEFWIQ